MNQASFFRTRAGLSIGDCMEIIASAKGSGTKACSLEWVAHATGERAVQIGGLAAGVAVIERRSVPKDEVDRILDEERDRIKQATGHSPGCKQSREMREDIVAKLLDTVIPRRTSVDVLINPEHRLLIIGSRSTAAVDAVCSSIANADAPSDARTLSSIQTSTSLAAAMSGWVHDGLFPGGLWLGGKCRLHNHSSKETISYKCQSIGDQEDVRQRIKSGMKVIDLAMGSEFVGFSLREDMTISGLDIDHVRAMPGEFDGNEFAGLFVEGETLRMVLDEIIAAAGGEVAQ